MKILCIEDGSINEESLQELIENPESCNGKILIYRQGSKQPYIIEV